MKKGLVSVVVPVYNSAEYLAECLDSILNQTYKNIEVICINDGSKDNSLAILKKYNKIDSRIKIISQENSGLSETRNNGFNSSNGEYICFIDSDDLIDCNMFKEAVQILSNNKIGAVIFNMEMFFPNGDRFNCFGGDLFLKENGIYSPKMDECCLNYTNVTPILYRKNCLKCKFEKGVLYEDWFFMTQFFSEVDQIYWINKPYYKYRRDFKFTLTSNISEKCLDLFHAYNQSNEFLKKSESLNRNSFINDIKILNEGIGFVLARLSKSDDEISRKFISNLAIIINSFSNTYYQFLKNYIDLDRRNLLDVLRNIDVDDSIVISKSFKKIKRIYKRKRVILKIKNVLRRILQNIRKILKNIVYCLSPSYRMGSYNNALLHEVLYKQNILIQQINENFSELTKEKRRR